MRSFADLCNDICAGESVEHDELMAAALTVDKWLYAYRNIIVGLLQSGVLPPETVVPVIELAEAIKLARHVALTDWIPRESWPGTEAFRQSVTDKPAAQRQQEMMNLGNYHQARMRKDVTEIAVAMEESKGVRKN